MKRLIFVLILLGLLAIPVNADSAVVVSAIAPQSVLPDSYVDITIDVSYIDDFDSCNFELTVSNMEIVDIMPGKIGNEALPLTGYNEVSTGKYIVLVNVPGVPGISGEGYLVAIRGHVVGGTGQHAAITVSNACLVNNRAEILESVCLSASIYITDGCNGDANQNGEVDMGDVIYIERVILGLTPLTDCCDVNRDGVVNMGDVIKVERIILGI